MDECEQDLRILRACCDALNLDPDGELCPDLEAIANGDGTLYQKLDRLKYQVADNMRAMRDPRPDP